MRLATKEECEEGLRKRKSRWFHVSEQRRKVRRVATGQTNESGRAGKEMGGVPSMTSRLILIQESRHKGQVYGGAQVYYCLAREVCQLRAAVPQGQGSETEGFEQEKTCGAAVLVHPFVEMEDGREVPLGNHRCSRRAEVEKSRSQTREVRMREVDAKGFFQGPLQGHPIIYNSVGCDV